MMDDLQRTGGRDALRRTSRLSIGGSILLVAVIASPVRPQQADAPPEDEASGTKRPRIGRIEKDMVRTDYSQDCLSSGCHAQLNRTPWVHSPVAVGACETCHTPEGNDSRHRFRLTRAKDQLCSFCHLPGSTKEFSHKVYAEADCQACHDPHGGATAAILRTLDGSKLCGKCHDAHTPRKLAAHEPAEPFPFLHDPVKKGQCLDCHRAHESDHAALMVLPERELCLKCHENVTQSLTNSAHVHKPLETECRSCHSSHGSTERALLREPPAVLCTGCHEEIAKQMTLQSLDVHGALSSDGSCLHCHTGHVGETKHFVRSPASDACFGCHGRELVLPGRTIANVAAEVQSAKFKHGPVGTGDCQACHLAHASPHQRLLNREYSLQFYEPFAESTFSLCFSCHDKALVSEERTTATAFRDGDRNLHYVHVHREKGRTCGVCHAAHASDQPALMRQSVPFGLGGWRLPIRYERTASGGTCASGCHQKLGYNNRRMRTGDAPATSKDGDNTEKE